jgi:hypothetical protein
MNYQLISHPSHPYLECLPGEEKLAGEREALDLVAACMENGASRLLLHADILTQDFYNLRTGVAGAILQKFVNYHIRAAAVLTPELVDQGRFREMVFEANHGSQFRVFFDRETAEQWLTSA